MVDLPALLSELDGTLLQAAVSPPLARAVVGDLFRMAGRRPPPDDAFAGWEPQLALCAHVLIASSLRPLTVAALHHLSEPAWPRLEPCLEAATPLTLQLLRDNPFRREELVRRWLATWEIPIAGEAPAASAQRLDALDYRQALREYAVAEQARRDEAAARRQQREAARRAEAESRGWRE